MIDYIGFGISLLAVAICFILNHKLRQMKKMLDEEAGIRQQQDNKLYHIYSSQFKVAMGQPTNWEIKQQQQQAYQQQQRQQQQAYQQQQQRPQQTQRRHFDDLIEQTQEER